MLCDSDKYETLVRHRPPKTPSRICCIILNSANLVWPNTALHISSEIIFIIFSRKSSQRRWHENNVFIGILTCLPSVKTRLNHSPGVVQGSDWRVRLSSSPRTDLPRHFEVDLAGFRHRRSPEANISTPWRSLLGKVTITVVWRRCLALCGFYKVLCGRSRVSDSGRGPIVLIAHQSRDLRPYGWRFEVGLTLTTRALIRLAAARRCIIGGQGRCHQQVVDSTGAQLWAVTNAVEREVGGQ